MMWSIYPYTLRCLDGCFIIFKVALVIALFLGDRVAKVAQSCFHSGVYFHYDMMKYHMPLVSHAF